MPKPARFALYLICAVQAYFAVAFFMQHPSATRWWPFAGTPPLSFMFISSIFAAAAASTAWAVASRQYGSLAGIGLDYLIILAPVAVLSYQLGAAGGDPRMTGYAAACVLGALFGLALLSWSARQPLDQTIPMPGPVRWSFVIFIVALLIVSTRLILKVPNVMPWKVSPDLSVGIGWMFLGAAAYFAYGLMRPSWPNTAGQLIGFLAYDVVLIVPFLKRMPTVPEQHVVGQWIYTSVVIYSGLLAIYYLFLHKQTRLWARGAGSPRRAGAVPAAAPGLR